LNREWVVYAVDLRWLYILDETVKGLLK